MSTIVATTVQVHVCRYHAQTPYLVLKRSADEPVHPHLWQVVTGHIEPGESAGQAAIREVFEETGIVTTKLDVLPMTGSFYLAHRDEVHLTPVFACLVPDNTKVTLSDEHQDFSWCSFEEARNLLVFPGHHQGHDLIPKWIFDDRFRSILQKFRLFP